MAANKPVLVASAAMLAAAAALIMKWEGVRYLPYQDVVGVWTVCYGHTGKDVIPGKKYTIEECKTLLYRDMTAARHYVHLCIGPVAPGPEAALTSAVFNLGPKVVCGSTLQKVALRDGFPPACKHLDSWKYAGGRVYRGLVLRRADERAVCEGRIKP